MGKNRSTSDSKSSVARAGKNADKGKLVVVDDELSSISSGIDANAVHKKEQAKEKAQRRAARKRDAKQHAGTASSSHSGNGTSLCVPDVDDPDVALDRMLAAQTLQSHPPMPQLPAPDPSSVLITGAIGPTNVDQFPMRIPAQMAHAAWTSGSPSASVPDQNSTGLSGGLDLSVLRTLLRETVNESMASVHSSISTLEQNVQRSVSSLEARVCALEQANRTQSTDAPRTQDMAAASEQPSSGPRPRSVDHEPRRGGLVQRGAPRARSLPRNQGSTVAFSVNTQGSTNPEPAAQEWRKRTVVLSGFDTKRTIQEYKAIASSQLNLPEGARVLTRAKFSITCNVELESPEHAKALIDSFRQQARVVDNKRIFANPSLSLHPAAARRGWMVRTARRVLLSHDDKLQLSICTRSDTLYLRREEIFYVRGDQVFFTDSWPSHVPKADLVHLFRDNPGGG
eukprot:5916451-Amphidinium_carterae.2